MANRICPKCGNSVPKYVVVDGKKRNCQRRKYCFECSPFGQHNTRKIEFGNDEHIKKCKECEKLHDNKGTRCLCCYFKKRQTEVRRKVQTIVGSSCWICGYDKTKRNLCFHHVDESTKLFGLTTRELMLKWERVITEMKKCVFVCANCHGEIHENIVSKKKVLEIWMTKWFRNN